ncbi:MAG TPA: T9SS type A sorting domain-containing protein, partial [Puia sp.]|nr:T9SS type A sorting domain-containing protein [Puia sp.]
LNPTGFQEPFYGALDEVRIWNTQRTSAEINTYMNNTLTGSESGLAALFSMDQGSSGGTNTGLRTAIDGTSANNHGTLSNFALSGSSSNWITHSLVTLPVSISAFTGLRDGNTTQLDWTTAQEENSRDFVVERSSDGERFTAIGMVDAAGNSHTVRNYSFTDVSPADGVNYYRLREEDLDGHANYSGTVTVNFNAAPDQAAALSPNPAVSHITLSITGATGGAGVVCVNDLSGRTLLMRNVSLQQGSNQVTIGLAGLPSGTYVLTIRQTSGLVSREFQIIK